MTIAPTLERTMTLTRWASSASPRPSTVWAMIPDPITKMSVSLTLYQNVGS